MFFRWTRVQRDVVDTTKGLFSDVANNIINASETKFVLEINTKFAVSILQRSYNEQLGLEEATEATRKDIAKQVGNWKPWVYVAQTTRPCSRPVTRLLRNEHGLFAARKFSKGDIVGVYMGRKGLRKQDAAYSIQLKVSNETVVVDARGGVDSKAPSWLGIHFINDPTDPSDQGGETIRQKQRKWNVEIKASGVAIATRTIEVNQELFTNYQRTNVR
jgi:hypothetical protein